MIINKLTPGPAVPHEINVVIEIPSQSGPVKYEMDKDSGALKVDRFMTTAMYYPCNYGYIPNTLCPDGDPCDVLVITPFPLISGSTICCRPVGILKMVDEHGEDAKILAVPADSISKAYQHVKEAPDLSPALIETIEHFFRHYKDLEPNKWVKVEGWGNTEEAHAVIEDSVKSFEQQQ